MHHGRYVRNGEQDMWREECSKVAGKRRRKKGVRRR